MGKFIFDNSVGRQSTMLLKASLTGDKFPCYFSEFLRAMTLQDNSTIFIS